MDEKLSNRPVSVVALYRFARLARFKALQQPLLDLCNAHGMKGTLLLAHEGINGTVAGTKDAIQNLVNHLHSWPEFVGAEIKYSYAGVMPFNRMKVRLKKEIVTMGQMEIDPLLSVGTYVAPQNWNALISDPDTVVIDTRNDYETRVGIFDQAIDPNTKTFSEFPEWVKNNRNLLAGKKVAMYCTGGIRCEKATAYVKGLGIQDVYHLKGGILGYLEQVPEELSLWKGECFVFDERVSVGHGLVIGETILCRACRQPVSTDDQNSPDYLEGISCPHCISLRSNADRARYAERQKQVHRSKLRGTRHIGDS